MGQHYLWRRRSPPHSGPFREFFDMSRYFITNPPPKILFLYGPSLRKRSTMCSQLMQDEEKPEQLEFPKPQLN